MKQLLILLFIPIFGFSQASLEQELDSIATQEAANVFIKSHKNTKGELFTFNKEKHKTRLADDIFKFSVGGKKVVKTDIKNTYYKIIDRDEVLHYRVSYIYFDGNKMTLEEINIKRSKIISQYNEGYNFEALVKIHSMDKNATRGGDLGWFLEGKTHPKFENSVKIHEIDDIFALDIEDKKWYYVVLKTFEPKLIEEITILKFTEVAK